MIGAVPCDGVTPLISTITTDVTEDNQNSIQILSLSSHRETELPRGGTQADARTSVLLTILRHSSFPGWREYSAGVEYMPYASLISAAGDLLKDLAYVGKAGALTPDQCLSKCGSPD